MLRQIWQITDQHELSLQVFETYVIMPLPDVYLK